MADWDRELLNAELKAGIDAVEFWMNSEYPHYLASCGGKPTEEDFQRYMRERLAAADPEQKKRIEDGLICCGIRAALESEPATVMSSAELLQRLAEKNKTRGEMSTTATPDCPPNEKINNIK